MPSITEPTVVERRSVVNATAGQVWQRVVTPEGIDDELRPHFAVTID